MPVAHRQQSRPASPSHAGSTASPKEARIMQITTEATNSSPATEVVRTALLARLEWRISSMTRQLLSSAAEDQAQSDMDVLPHPTA